MVRAAKAYPGVVGDMILAADKRVKRKTFGGWSVLRTGKGKRSRRRGRR
jgi:hypothetical protein